MSTAGCGGNGTTIETAGQGFSLEEDLQNFTNQLEFEITEPMYAVFTGEVLKVQEGEPFDLVFMEISESHTPAGIENDPYEGKTIVPGTRLVVEWMGNTVPEVGKWYMVPAEFVPAIKGIRVTLKGDPREAPAQEQGEEEASS
jgi:hypothetical protein